MTRSTAAGKDDTIQLSTAERYLLDKSVLPVPTSPAPDVTFDRKTTDDNNAEVLIDAANKQNLKLSNFILQNGVSDWICTLCRQHFTRGYSLQEHIRVVHMKERPHQCSNCPMRFGKRSNMTAHEKVCKVKTEKELLKTYGKFTGLPPPKSEWAVVSKLHADLNWNFELLSFSVVSPPSLSPRMHLFLLDFFLLLSRSSDCFSDVRSFTAADCVSNVLNLFFGIKLE